MPEPSPAATSTPASRHRPRPVHPRTHPRSRPRSAAAALDATRPLGRRGPRWLAQLQHLAAAARAWDERGRPAADLYRGHASRPRSKRSTTAAPSRRRARFRRRRPRRPRHEVRSARRTTRRLRRLLVGVGALLLVALIAGALAFEQRRQARNNENEAVAQRTWRRKQQERSPGPAWRSRTSRRPSTSMLGGVHQQQEAVGPSTSGPQQEERRRRCER